MIIALVRTQISVDAGTTVINASKYIAGISFGGANCGILIKSPIPLIGISKGIKAPHVTTASTLLFLREIR
jgi:hypothetical protein